METADFSEKLCLSMISDYTFTIIRNRWLHGYNLWFVVYRLWLRRSRVTIGSFKLSMSHVRKRWAV